MKKNVFASTVGFVKAISTNWLSTLIATVMDVLEFSAQIRECQYLTRRAGKE